MPTTTVGIVFEVLNKGSANLAKIERDVGSLGRSLSSLGKLTLGAAGIGSIGYALAKTAAEIERVGNTSQKLGMTTESLSALEFAARRAGIASTELDTAVENMSRRFSEAARGGGEAKYAIAELGLDAAKLAAMDPAQAVAAIADQMMRIPNQADKLRVTYQIFGRGQSEMVNLLAQGSAGLAAAAERGAKYGRVLSSLDVAQVTAANRALGEMKEIVAGVLTRAVVEFSPLVEALAGQITDAATAGGGFGRAVTTAFEAAALGAARFAGILQKITDLGSGRRIETETWNRYNRYMEERGIRPRSVLTGAPNAAVWERIHSEVRAELGPTDYLAQVETAFGDLRERMAAAESRRINEQWNKRYLLVPGPFGFTTPISRGALGPAPGLAAGEGGMALSATQERDQAAVERMKLALRDEITTAYLAKTAHAELAKSIEFERTVRAAYPGDIERQNRLIAEYKDNVQALVRVEEDRRRKVAQGEFNARVREEIESLRQEGELLQMGRLERERQVVVQRAINEAQKLGVELSAAQKAELAQQVEELQKLRGETGGFWAGVGAGVRELNDELLTTAEIGRDLTKQLRDGVVGSLTDAIFRSEDLGDSLKRVALNLAEYYVQESILKPMVTSGIGLIGSLVGSLTGGAAGTYSGVGTGPVTAGLGDVFEHGRLQRFAAGTVVAKPTFFPMADGGVGEMGEAGPEGIFPLERVGGKLGIRAAGAGVSTKRIEDLLAELVAKKTDLPPIIVALTEEQILNVLRGRNGREVQLENSRIYGGG